MGIKKKAGRKVNELGRRGGGAASEDGGMGK